MIRSIRWRIAIPFVFLIVLLMTAVGIYLSNIVRQTYQNDLKNQLISEAIIARDNLVNEFGDGQSDLVLDDQAQKWASLINARVTLIAADGTVIGESHDDRTRMDNHANRPEILQAASDGNGVSIRFSHTEGYDTLYVAVPVENNGARVGYIRLSLPLEAIQKNIQQVQRTIAVFTVIAAIVAILLAMGIASQTTRPLRELSQAVDRLATGDMGKRIIPSTSDEVGQLTKAFNRMGEQLSSEINALETEREKLSAVLNEMSDGVLIVDKGGQIQLINPAAASMFGVSQEEALGRSLIEALRQYQLVDLWRKCQATNESQAVLVEIPAKRLYLQTVATSLGKALPDSTLLLFQNLTRVRQLETVRQDFISNISHELRTPLSSLKALTETLLETALDDPPAARQFLQRMETEVDALSLMVSELLELTRIESGRVPLKMEAVSARELIDQAVERLRLQAERAGLSVETTCQEEIPPVLADPSRLEQVLVNLIHNAIKFTPSRGTIRVGCQLVEDKVLFSVQDTGIGIPEEDLSRIFERFYKTDRARSGGGTGLGLAIARHLVEAHGGRVWAESVEEQGSTFYFTVPLAV
jgi:two-component system, OmpR family, phosphate regulon sensor histidine kinase PhoR